MAYRLRIKASVRPFPCEMWRLRFEMVIGARRLLHWRPFGGSHIATAAVDPHGGIVTIASANTANDTPLRAKL